MLEITYNVSEELWHVKEIMFKCVTVVEAKQFVFEIEQRENDVVEEI